MASRDHPTIDDVLGEFLAEQRERLSARTFRNYDEVVELLRHSLDGYAYNSLDGDERRRWEKAFESGDEGAFCHLFGPEKIPEHLGEFLGYLMVRKVIAGQELLRASGTVTGKLVTWLAARGYIDRDSADHATGRAQDASRDLPVADRLGGLLRRRRGRTRDRRRRRSTIKTGSRITSRSATWSPVGSGSRAASDRSPSHARPAISHDRDGRYPSRRHGPRTAGTCSRSASSTPDPRRTGPDPSAQHADRARLPARDRTPRRCSLSGWPAREARP